MSRFELFDWGFQNAEQKPDEGRQKTENSMELRVIEMKAVLRDRRVAHAGEFEQRFGWSDRQCRQIAAASDGGILGTNGGYVLTERATPEEFDAANGRIYSQARNMMRRAIRERRVRHQMIGQS